MRIISGTYKGRRIDLPKKSGVRPTTDFAKEGLFNWLGNFLDVENIKVLDLFCGSGSISLEFVSREAIEVTSVDRDKINVVHLNQLKSQWEIENLKTSLSDVFKFIKFTKERYDLIFADPPYQFKYYDQLIERILNGRLLQENGHFILEHSVRLKDLPSAHLIESKHYGQVAFSIFTKK